MLRRLLLAFAAATSLSPTLGVAAAFDPAKGFRPPIPDALISNLSEGVLDRFPQFQCGEAACEPATDSERREGLVALEDAREVIRKGMLSQVGACAGLDWQRVGFLPMMADWRQRRRASNRQLAFVAGLHGAAMGAVLSSFGGSCPKDNPAAPRTRG